MFQLYIQSKFYQNISGKIGLSLQRIRSTFRIRHMKSTHLVLYDPTKHNFQIIHIFLIKMGAKASLCCLPHVSMISSPNNLIPEES